MFAVIEVQAAEYTALTAATVCPEFSFPGASCFPANLNLGSTELLLLCNHVTCFSRCTGWNKNEQLPVQSTKLCRDWLFWSNRNSLREQTKHDACSYGLLATAELMSLFYSLADHWHADDSSFLKLTNVFFSDVSRETSCHWTREDETFKNWPRSRTIRQN